MTDKFREKIEKLASEMEGGIICSTEKASDETGVVFVKGYAHDIMGYLASIITGFSTQAEISEIEILHQLLNVFNYDKEISIGESELDEFLSQYDHGVLNIQTGPINVTATRGDYDDVLDSLAMIILSLSKSISQEELLIDIKNRIKDIEQKRGDVKLC